MDGLSQYLDALEREERYRVDGVLKSSEFETTQRVYYRDEGGTEQGPFIRKIIARDSGLGSAYELVYQACQQGRRFAHIPAVVECYQRDQTTVVVMEYIEGPTLADYVYEHDPSLHLASEIFPRLCDAVAELHTQFSSPIIHRDLKPSNIIIRDGVPVIIDLGIARERKEQAETDTTHFGTRAYAPPEQFGYGQTTERSDVYAMGMLLYFMLVEKTPNAKVVQEGFNDVRIPEPMRRTIACATSFDPERRYASVQELGKAFALALIQVGAAQMAEGIQMPEGALQGQAGSPFDTGAHEQPAAPSFYAGTAQPAPPRNLGEDIASSAVSEKLPPWKMGGRNIAVLLIYVWLACSSIWVGFHPEQFSSNYPTAFHLFAYILYLPLFLALLAYLAMNKARLRACFPVLGRFQGRHSKAILALIFVAFFVVFGIVGYATGALQVIG